MDAVDDMVRDAMKALEQGATPRDYFDELPGRIDRRLEGRMQIEQHEEDSGLHDIKAMAQTTRERARARHSSQHEIDQTLLSASSSGLHAVALPDPSKVAHASDEQVRELARSTGQHAAVAAPVEAVAPVAPAPRAARSEAKKPAVPAWLWIGGGLAGAAAAAVAFVAFGGTKDQAPAAPATPAPTIARQEAPPAPPPPPAIETRGIAEDDLAPPAAAEPPPAAAPAAAPEAAAIAAKDDGEEAKAEAKAVKKDAPKDARPEPTKKKADDKAAPPPVEKEKKLDGAVIGAGDEDQFGIADIVAGGGKKKDEGPAKTELTSKEVRDGLASITGAAKACYGAHGQGGTVKVKLTIDPSGKVTKAAAQGELAGTPAGDCVVDAVKSASFPAWEGRPKSTSFVVLLSD